MALQDATNPMQGISGPGKFAKRTDLEYQSPEYGAGVQYAQDKGGAPLATSPDVRGAAPSTFRRDVERGTAAGAPTTGGLSDGLVSLYAPTQRPNEPITTGIDIGPGAGSEALMMKSQFAQQKVSTALAKMLPYDSTGEVAILYQQALARGM